ncbi:hypothetical protein HK103_002670 [Boothiomyces macroporosus]|uniref:DUF803 domain membrane protein n=1 Tax=Boothiomyces macroporosus TaxID=261099 RepID=A0AAD5YB78_9FUNG|nr:hypothetical protein HK103_002670 [Boothiomyces macroporosus]
MSNDEVPAWFQTVGIILALSSGIFNGMAYVLQKKGLIETTSESEATGNDYTYLKSKSWWFGITCMIMGEISNFGAYSFTPAIIVTPLGAVSVVVSAVLSVIFLGEKINFSGGCGIILCIIGSTIIVLHGPPSTQTDTIPQFFSYVLQPGFLVYTFLCGVLVIWLIFKVGPVYGHVQPIVYLSINAFAGAYLVNSAQGFGSSVVYTIRNTGDNQFLHWPIYPLFVFMCLDAVLQINYLNKSLQHFSTSIVTPVSYVFFSTTTIITSAILYRGFNVATLVDGMTIILGFLVIIIGVALLFQYNLKLNKLAQAQAANDPEVFELESAINEPRTDQDPITLMLQSFPTLTRANSVPTQSRAKTQWFFRPAQTTIEEAKEPRVSENSSISSIVGVRSNTYPRARQSPVELDDIENGLSAKSGQTITAEKDSDEIRRA